MNGRVDRHGRALITILIRPSDVAAAHQLEVWIDTGFNGDLVLPQHQIDELDLQPSGTLKAVLADGSVISLKRYSCLIDWFGQVRDLEVVANDGDYPLLGGGLLCDHDLRISYRTGTVAID